MKDIHLHHPFACQGHVEGLEMEIKKKKKIN
jgi:hypothetical protein